MLCSAIISDTLIGHIRHQSQLMIYQLKYPHKNWLMYLLTTKRSRKKLLWHVYKSSISISNGKIRQCIRCSETVKLSWWKEKWSRKVRTKNWNTSPDVKTCVFLNFSHRFVQIIETRRPMKVKKGHAISQTVKSGPISLLFEGCWPLSSVSRDVVLWTNPSLNAQGSVCVSKAGSTKRMPGLVVFNTCLYMHASTWNRCGMPACHVNTKIRDEAVSKPY